MWARFISRNVTLSRVGVEHSSPIFHSNRGFHGTKSRFDSDPKDPDGKSGSKNEDNQDKKPKRSDSTLRLRNLMKDAARPMPQTENPVKLSRPKRREKPTVSSKDLDDDLVSATRDVAKHVSQGEPKRKVKIESDLLRHLKNTQRQSSVNLEDLLGDIKVEKKPQESESEKRFGRSKGSPTERELTREQKEFLEMRRRQRRDQFGGPRGGDDQEDRMGERIVLPKNLFARAPLGIFTEPVPENPDRSHEIPMKTWDACQMREVRVINWRPPRNVVEDMIDLTEKQILWQFPIDNEQGINYDELEPFHQHVFLERHLEPWCPKEGPVRHFMELVCVGLQKNAHMTVAKKLETIEWFKNYLMSEEKQEVFKLSEVQ